MCITLWDEDCVAGFRLEEDFVVRERLRQRQKQRRSRGGRRVCAEVAKENRWEEGAEEGELFFAAGAGHEAVDGVERGDVFVQDRGHLFGDGHLHAVLLR